MSQHILVIVWLLVRSMLLKLAIRDLRVKFQEAKSNEAAQQCLTLRYPSHELEKLAYEINQYVGEYYMQKGKFHQDVRDIRKEITNLSHDLRTPLTSILGYLDLMDVDNLTQEQLNALEVIKRRSNQLNSLIAQLYEYARLENNEYQLSMEEVDIYRIMKEQILDPYMEFSEAGITLVPQLPDLNEPIYIKADPQGLDRI